MRWSRRYCSSLAWSIWIIIFGVYTAAACAGHPILHGEAHPPNCTHSSSPIAHGHDKPILFADDGTFPLRQTLLFPAVSLTSLNVRRASALVLLPHQLSYTSEHVFVSIPYAFLPVLRL